VVGAEGTRAHEGQLASGLALGALQEAVGGRQSLPELRALLTGRLLRPHVDAAPTDIDLGVRVGPQVEVPGRGAGGAGVGGDNNERVVVCQVLHRRGPGPAGAAPGGLQQKDGLAAHAAEDASARVLVCPTVQACRPAWH
jgi:hypothetical protein